MPLGGYRGADVAKTVEYRDQHINLNIYLNCGRITQMICQRISVQNS